MSKLFWQLVRRLLLNAEAGHSVSILIFHRVMTERDPLRPSEPTVEEFEEIIRFISGNFRVAALHDAIVKQQSNEKAGHAVAITFDDGYADNLTLAMPILRKYAVPATFFITSGELDGGMMWNDQIIEAVRANEGDVLDARSFGLDQYQTLGVDNQRQTIKALVSKLKYRSVSERSDIASSIFRQCNAVRPGNLMLTSDQLRELADDNLAEIGGHTVGHPILQTLPIDAAYHEIVDGKVELEKILGSAIRCFAYPNGVPDVDYGIEHVRIVSDAGFELAVSTSHGAARKETDRFQLPRFTPWDREMTRFGLRMLHVARSRGVFSSSNEME